MTKPSPMSFIRLRGVRHNNLKNFDLDLPVGRLVVITGLSGSGKSSLAFDTLFAEGQRRYIETFSPYARQFFDRMDKPQVDRIEGIPPAIALEQRNAVKTTRSTVGTMTELCDYMKLLWPQLAQLHCRGCGQPVRQEPPQLIWDTLNAARDPRNPEFLLTFDLPLSEKLSLADSLALIAKQGYQRLLANGEILRVEEAAAHSAFRTLHSALTVVQDRLLLATASRSRFIEACEQAYHFGKGKLAVHARSPVSDSSRLTFHVLRRFSSRLHCAVCDLDYREPTPALFSFNHPVGACPKCKGFGRVISIDYGLALPDRSLTLAEGAVKPWRTGFSAECQDDLLKFCRARRVPTQVPFGQLPQHQQDWVINGDPDYGADDAHQWPYAWYGIKGYFKWLESKAYKMHVRVLLSRYRAYTTCPDCQGQRFQPDALLYFIDVGERPSPSSPAPGPSRLTLADFYALPIETALRVIEHLAAKHTFTPSDPLTLALDDVRARLRYLVEVGLGYLTLDRPTRTLSGGETERVNLTTCLGARLVNTLFVLDEPSVGLHPRDTVRLVRILEHLREAGNTVVVVEHEAGVIRAADQVVDLGPGSGEAGGQIVFQGAFAELLHSDRSLTGQYLSGRKRIELPPRRPVPVGQASRLSQAGNAPYALNEAFSSGAFNVSFPLTSSLSPRGGEGARRAGEGEPRQAASPIAGTNQSVPALTISDATRHNLKDLTVEIPLHRFVCLTGVSGSGKTTLVREVLLPALEAELTARRAERRSQRAEVRGQKSDEDTGRLEPEADEAASLTTDLRPLSSHLSGHEHLARVVLVDQSPLGKTPRSNPAVYTGAFEHIRELFAQTDLAKQRGLNASAFSFNSGQGQCERCRGAGFEKVEMQFLSDVFIRCPDCNGRRYRAHILEVKVEGKSELRVEKSPMSAGQRKRSTLHSSPRSTRAWSIADLLEATVDEAVLFLGGFPDQRPAERALTCLRLLQEVGLGYLRLGQPINTLSGGESQRLKLVSHLAESAVAANVSSRVKAEEPGDESQPRSYERGHTLFLFDEPTTGLHFDDVRVLLKVFQRLVDAGHSVLVIEHNLEVIKCADWVIDLGPEAGDRGGQLVACGTPEEVAACEASHTGRFLGEVLGH